jgi:hypothetical protein
VSQVIASFFIDELPCTTSHPFYADDYDPNFTNRGYVEEEITMEGDGVPVHHTFGGYSLFSPELKPNSSDGGPILPPSNEMRAEGILLRSPLPRLR